MNAEEAKKMVQLDEKSERLVAQRNAKKSEFEKLMEGARQLQASCTELIEQDSDSDTAVEFLSCKMKKFMSRLESEIKNC